MTNHFNIGDILQGEKNLRNEAYHPIIYLGETDKNDFFLGGMITHSSTSNNVRLEDVHFERKIDKDSRPSYFVNNFLFKKQEWGPFNVIGKLSNDGISFVKDNLNGSEPRIWEEYLH